VGQNSLRFIDPKDKIIFVAFFGPSIGAAAADAAVIVGAFLFSQNQFNESFPRDGVIPGTTENRGELDTPSVPSGPPEGGSSSQDKCIDDASKKFDQCKSRCQDASKLAECKIIFPANLAACLNKGDDGNNFPFDSNGPSFDNFDGIF